jgi:hypothetical protein
MWEPQPLTTLRASKACRGENFTLLHFEDAWGSGYITPPLLTTALNGGEWSTSSSNRFTPGGKSSRNPLDMRLGGSQSRSGLYREYEKNHLPLPRIEPQLSRHSARSLVPIPTELSRLINLETNWALLNSIQSKWNKLMKFLTNK